MWIAYGCIRLDHRSVCIYLCFCPCDPCQCIQCIPTPGRKMLSASPPLRLSASKHCYTAIFILLDMKTNKTSHFQPYYKILPETYPNMPLFWNVETLGWLEGSFLTTQVAERKANMQQDYAEICRVAPEFRSLATIREWMWARIVVASRNFGVTINGHKTDAMVPYADMLNHYRPRYAIDTLRCAV